MSDIIQTLWIGSPLSKMEQLSLKSFIDYGHEVHLYTYNNVGNVPKGVTIKNANEIMAETEIFQYKSGTYAIFADLFRWELLYQKGGFWIDTDMVCTQHLNFKDEIVIGRQDIHRVCTAILKFPRGHFFSKFTADRCRNPNKTMPFDSLRQIFYKKLRYFRYKNDPSKIHWGETAGPAGVTEALAYFNLLNHAKPFTYFYPIHFNNWKSLYDNTLTNDTHLFQDTHTIHLWNEMTRLEGRNFDKNGEFPPDSLFEQLKRKHNIS